MKHIVLCLVLHSFFSMVKPDCEYHLGFNHQVLCSNLPIKEGDILKLEGQKEPDTGVNFLTLNGVSGVLNDETLSFFPKAKLSIENSTIKKLTLPSKNDLDLQATTLSDSNSPQFWKDCCANLESLQVSSSQEAVSVEHLKLLAKLKSLYLINEQLSPKHLTKSTFEGLSSLEKLTLHSVGVEEINEDTFENLVNLKRLTLSDNKITEIKPDTFKSLKKLEALDLTGNDIGNLSLEMFSEQKQLKELRLHTRDFLKFGAEETKKAFPKLEKISLDYDDKYTDEARNFVKIINICPSYRMKSGGFMNTCI